MTHSLEQIFKTVLSSSMAFAALHATAQDTYTGEAVPYLRYVLSGHNFSDNPEQAPNDQFFRSVA